MPTYFGGGDHSNSAEVGAGTTVIYAIVGTASISGRATVGRIWVSSNDFNLTVKLALYTTSGGLPNTLIAETNPISIPSGTPAGYKDFTFPTPPPIEAGTVYAISLIKTTSNHFSLGKANSAGTYWFDTIPGTFDFPVTFTQEGSGSGAWDWQIGVDPGSATPVVRPSPTAQVFGLVTSWAISKPPGTVNGDLLIASMIIGASLGASRTIVPPSGWNQIQQQISNPFGLTASAMATFWKRAGASEPSSYTFGMNLSNDDTRVVAVMVAIQGAGNPEASNNQFTSGTNSTLISPDVSGLGAGRLDLRIVATQVATNNTLNMPSGYSFLAKAFSSPGGFIGVGMKLQAGSGSYGSQTFTQGESTVASDGGHSVVIPPSGPTVTPVTIAGAVTLTPSINLLKFRAIPIILFLALEFQRRVTRLVELQSSLSVTLSLIAQAQYRRVLATNVNFTLKYYPEFVRVTRKIFAATAGKAKLLSAKIRHGQ